MHFAAAAYLGFALRFGTSAQYQRLLANVPKAEGFGQKCVVKRSKSFQMWVKDLKT